MAKNKDGKKPNPHNKASDRLDALKQGADKARELKALAIRLRKANLKVETLKDELKHAKAIAKGFQSALEDEAADADQPSLFPPGTKEKTEKTKKAKKATAAADPEKKPDAEMKMAV